MTNLLAEALEVNRTITQLALRADSVGDEIGEAPPGYIYIYIYICISDSIIRIIIISSSSNSFIINYIPTLNT